MVAVSTTADPESPGLLKLSLPLFVCTRKVWTGVPRAGPLVTWVTSPVVTSVVSPCFVTVIPIIASAVPTTCPTPGIAVLILVPGLILAIAQSTPASVLKRNPTTLQVQQQQLECIGLPTSSASCPPLS